MKVRCTAIAIFDAPILAILEKQTPFGKIYSTESHLHKLRVLHNFVTQQKLK